MKEVREHGYIPTLKRNFAQGKIDRREFLRTSTLLGLSAGAAYAFVGKVTGESFVKPAKAAIPKGGTIRISMRVIDVKDPHTFSWVTDSNVSRQVCEYMSKTDQDNITRPYLLESWEASDDLKTWTLHVRKGVKWHNGRALDADDIIWNIRHVLDADTGSSVLGLMKGYMLKEVDKGDGTMTTELWDANAIEKLDSHTVRLNAQAAQLAVPEHLFHYPFPVLDPEEGGKFGPGSNGTGPFNLVEHEIGKKAVLTARDDYWGEGPYIDRLEYLDLGDDRTAALAALASKQVHGLDEASIVTLDALKALPHVDIHQVSTAQTTVVRGKVTAAPWDDPRVLKAVRLATDTPKILELAYRGLGAPGEHHHVCPIHPEYAKLPFMSQDIAAAKALLAEAGHPDGIDAKIDINADQPWEVNAIQGMVEQWKLAGIRVNINVLPRRHGPRPRLPLGRSVERVRVRQRRIRPLADQGRRHSRRRCAARGGARDRNPHAGGRTHRAAAVALGAHRHGQADKGLQDAPHLVPLRQRMGDRVVSRESGASSHWGPHRGPLFSLSSFFRKPCSCSAE